MSNENNSTKSRIGFMINNSNAFFTDGVVDTRKCVQAFTKWLGEKTAEINTLEPSGLSSKAGHKASLAQIDGENPTDLIQRVWGDAAPAVASVLLETGGKYSDETGLAIAIAMASKTDGNTAREFIRANKALGEESTKLFTSKRGPGGGVAFNTLYRQDLRLVK